MNHDAKTKWLARELARVARRIEQARRLLEEATGQVPRSQPRCDTCGALLPAESAAADTPGDAGER